MIGPDSLLKYMVEQHASDLFLKSEAKPFVRVRGCLSECGSHALSRAELTQFAYDLMGPDRQQIFQRERELNFAFERSSIGRFRANVLWQRGTLAMVIRRVQDRVPGFEELHLPVALLRRLAESRQGLVLISGPTASGKSTTAAAILDYLNQTHPCHIVTLEDPIEIQFEERHAIINQREVGIDTRSFTDGLKNVLRQSPDVLFLSDLRDREAMDAALFASESGQLVISCIHTTSAAATIERVVATFPPHQHELVRYRLSLVLKGIVSLRLLPCRDGVGQVPACEILVMTPTIRELIRESRSHDIPAFLHDGALHGMQTMTQALHRLIQIGAVSMEDAVQASEHPEELELALRGIRGIRDVARG